MAQKTTGCISRDLCQHPGETFVVVPDDTKPRSVLRTDHNATFVGLNLKGVWMSKWFLASTARESAGPDTTNNRFGLACEISLNPWRANLSYSLDVRAARDHFFHSVGGVFYVSRKRFRNTQACQSFGLALVAATLSTSEKYQLTV